MKVFVTAHPASGRNFVEQKDATHFEVYVTATAQNNKANDAIVAAIAGYFKLPKSLVTITRGHKNRHKTLLVDSEIPLF